MLIDCSVQGAWGVIPIHLMELSPGSLRAFVVGTSYQLGNLVSSASSTIEATIGERFPLPTKVEADGTEVTRYDYGKGSTHCLLFCQHANTSCSHLHLHGMRVRLCHFAHVLGT